MADEDPNRPPEGAPPAPGKPADGQPGAPGAAPGAAPAPNKPWQRPGGNRPGPGAAAPSGRPGGGRPTPAAPGGPSASGPRPAVPPRPSPPATEPGRKGPPPGKDWKRHTLLRVGAAPFELPQDKTITIGRSDECELSIPSARISRKHAEIGWRDGKPYVKDLGSQNGTQVNGKRIPAEHLLVDNDEVVIGPFLVTYRVMGGVGSVGKTAQAPDKNALTQPMLADAMAGRLDQMGMFELLQTLEFNKKSGTLELFGTEDGDGRMVLQDGAPIHAECEGQSGEEAIYVMIRQKSGQFSLSPQIDEAQRTIARSMTSILLEAGRRQDEGNAPPPG